MSVGSHVNRRGSPTPRDDAQLVRLCRSGDSRARERLLARLGCVGRMLAGANARMGEPLTPEELSDVTVGALVVVWRKLDEYRGASVLETWIWRVSSAELMAQLRRRGRFPAPLEELDPAERARLGPERAEVLEHERLQRSLDRLEPAEADFIRLKHLELLGFAEIASRLGGMGATIKPRYFAGLLKLRRLLDPTGEESETHASEGHDRDLARLLGGADDPRGLLAASELSGCEDCAQALVDLQALGERLEALGAFERDLLASSRVQGVDLSGTRVRAALARELAPPAAPLTRRPDVLRLRWIVALAALLAAALIYQMIGDVAFSGGPEVDAAQLPPGDGRRPWGAVAEYSPFTWNHALPDGGWFRVVVYDGGSGDRVFESEDLYVTELVLSDDQEHGLPDAIRWNVRIYDGSSWIGYVEGPELRARRP